MEKYTTTKLKDTDKLQKPEWQTEQDKVILSTDAYAIADLIESLTKKMELARLK